MTKATNGKNGKTSNGKAGKSGKPAAAPATAGPAVTAPAPTLAVVGCGDAYRYSVRFRLSDGTAIDVIPVGCGSMDAVLAARDRLITATQATFNKGGAA